MDPKKRKKKMGPKMAHGKRKKKTKSLLRNDVSGSTSRKPRNCSSF